MSELKRKAINFDLDTNIMKELGLYPGGYQVLGKSFEKQGFIHRQGSGYISKSKMSNNKVNDVIEKVVLENPWLSECVKKIDVTDIGRQHDLTAIVRRFGAMLSARQDSKVESTEKKLTSSDEAVIKTIRLSKQSAEFDKLYLGSDKSAGADRRLAQIIHFFTNGDEAQGSRIFKSSALYKAGNGDSYIKELFAELAKSFKSATDTFSNHKDGLRKRDGRGR